MKSLQRSISRGFHNQIIVDNIIADSIAFDSISFSFCFREANCVAHRLAKWALSSFSSSVWLNGGPSWIADFVCFDLII